MKKPPQGRNPCGGLISAISRNPFAWLSPEIELIKTRFIESGLDENLDCVEVSSAAQQMETCNERKLPVSNYRATYSLKSRGNQNPPERKKNLDAAN